MAESLVFPGDFLSTEEEFLPGQNAYVSDDGRVLADSVGKPLFDSSKREVSVQKSARIVKAIEPGAIVVGRVILVKDSSVVVELIEAAQEGEPRRILQRNAVIMISKASFDFVKSLSSEFRIGDIVKARVIKQSVYGTDLSTAERLLGVIKAFCVECRSPLHVFGGKLKCTSCGSIETRKLSEEYAGK